MPDVETTLTRLVAASAPQPSSGACPGISAGRLQGIEPTGNRVEVRGLDFFELEDGELVTNTAYTTA